MRRRTTGLPHCQIFESEHHARAWLESRAWKDGPVCPHCGNGGQNRITQLGGRSHRAGLYQCNSPSCRRQFTVTVGTIFEDSKIPLHKWLAALFLISTPGARVPVTHMHRALGVSYKSTWFMVHRLQQALPPRVTTSDLTQATSDLRHLLSQTLSAAKDEQPAGSSAPAPAPVAKAKTDRRRPSKPTNSDELVRNAARFAEVAALISEVMRERAALLREFEPQSDDPKYRTGKPRPDSSEAYPYGKYRWSEMFKTSKK